MSMVDQAPAGQVRAPAFKDNWAAANWGLILGVAALIAILFDAEMRKRLFDRRLLLTAAISIAIVLPHAMWFVNHMSLATDKTFDKMTGSGSDGLSPRRGQVTPREIHIERNR